MPLVSIIIPVYNAEEFIKKTIESALSQTVKDIEIVIVDDCSSDESFRICSEMATHDSRIKVLRTESNFGCPGGPRNIGVSSSSGSWVAFLDSDDLWHSQKLEVQLAALKSHNAKFCSSQSQLFVKDSEYLLDKNIFPFDVKKVTYLSQMFNYQTPTSSVILCRSLAQSEPFLEGIDFKAREDIDCWLRIHKRIKFSIKINKNLMGYRVVEGQISGNKIAMISKTFHCYKHTSGIDNKFFNILPAMLTASHFIRALINRLLKKSI